MTEDLNCNNIIFKELTKIKEESDELFSPVFSEESLINLKIQIKEGLNKLNIISCIFNLKDLKEDNLGFLGNSEIWAILKRFETENTEEIIIPKIIDFLIDNNNIYENFINNEKVKENIIQFLIDGEMFKYLTVENEYRKLISSSEGSYKAIIKLIKSNKNINNRNFKGYYAGKIKDLEKTNSELMFYKKKAWKEIKEILKKFIIMILKKLKIIF